MDKPSRIVQEWFKFSRHDILAAKTLWEANNPNLWANIGFLCQQAAEKALKGLQIYKEMISRIPYSE